MDVYPPLLAVCGTRPEVVKMAPVIAALRARGRRVLLVMTGQHPDLAPQMLRELGLCASLTGARYTTTTEVYPDSSRTTPDECKRAQAAAVCAALDYVLAVQLGVSAA